MSELDDKLAQWREQTEALTPPDALVAELTALAAAQAVAPAVGKAVAAKGVAMKVVLTLAALGIIGTSIAVTAHRLTRFGPSPVFTEPVEATPVRASTQSFITVRSNKPAEVFVDGVKLGRSPIVHKNITAGPHQLQVNCLGDAGVFSAGVKPIEVPAGAQFEVVSTCIEKYVWPDGGEVAAGSPPAER